MERAPHADAGPDRGQRRGAGLPDGAAPPEPAGRAGPARRPHLPGRAVEESASGQQDPRKDRRRRRRSAAHRLPLPQRRHLRRRPVGLLGHWPHR